LRGGARRALLGGAAGRPREQTKPAKWPERTQMTKRFADYRPDGEPGVEVTHKLVPLEKPRIFDSIEAAAEFLEISPEDLVNYLEAPTN
jgi:hypothetical protein